MSKKIILNDKEVVFNEDVSAAQDWRNLDLDRILEAIRFGTFGSGPTIPGTVQGAAIISGLELGVSSTNLTVTVGGGTALFGFAGADPNFDNIYQMATAYAPTTLTLPVASTTLYRWDIIEVSAQQITTTETRKVLTPVGPIQRLVDTVVPKVKTNQLVFRVRPGTPGTAAAALTPSLQPDPAWLPLYAIRVEPASLHTNTLISFDLRLWLNNFRVSNRLGAASDGWQNRPELYKDSAPRVFTSQNLITIGGYTSPIGVDAGNPSAPFRALININVDRPSGITYVTDKWYYLYAARPHANCGLTTLTISALPPPNGNFLAINNGNGSRSGLPLPAPWPTDSASVAHYLGAVRLYDTGGGNFAVRDFMKIGDYVALASYQLGTSPPGANTSNIFLTTTVTSGTHTLTVTPGIGGDPLVPDHTRLVRTLWMVHALGAGTTFIVTTIDDFVLLEQPVDVGTRAYITLDIPLPFDGSMQFRYKVTTTGSTEIAATVLGFYEGMS